MENFNQTITNNVGNLLIEFLKCSCIPDHYLKIKIKR